ncbi:MAG: CvpA family protein [Pseudomonadota bacterium]|nr:CvpA family protein [Pseudomonadota bacterium]
MSFTIADVIVGGVIVLSALFGLMRGFTREVLSLGSWVGAGFAAWFAMPHVQPMVLEQVGDRTVADIVSAVAVFLVALVVLTILTHMIASRVRESAAVGAVDRSLGLVFGVARGGLIVIAAWLLIDYMVPDNPPRAVRDSVSLPYVKRATDMVMSLVPGTLSDRTREQADETRETIDRAGEAAGALRRLGGDGKAQDGEGQKGYTTEQNRALERLFDSTTDRQ